MSKKRVENYVYKLGDILGQGSFGTVYRGIDQTTKEGVAVKVLSKDKSTKIITKVNMDEYRREALRL